MSKWIIEKYDSTERCGRWELPGTFTESDIEQVLRNLVCTSLNDAEVIAANLPLGDHSRAPLLDRVGSDDPISFGSNPYYIAKRT